MPHTLTAPELQALATALRAEIDWLSQVIDARIQLHFKSDNTSTDPSLKPPKLSPDSSLYGKLVSELKLTREDRLLLALALAPDLTPQALDVFFIKNQNFDRVFTEFGGAKSVQHAGFLPTCETALFILAGDDLKERLRAMELFNREQPLFARQLLQLGTVAEGEPVWSAALRLSPAFLNQLITVADGHVDAAAFSAARLTPNLGWDDLVLSPQTNEGISEIRAWAAHQTTLRTAWGLDRYLKPGFRAFFHGPSGTGKTLVACLLGQALGVDVYRVDLTQVSAKPADEMKKSLTAAFSEAEGRNWILLFDKANAFFSPCTVPTNSLDGRINQAATYLLQHIEEHPGIVIIEVNSDAKLDPAFARCFDAKIPFTLPDAEQRLQLWRGIFGKNEHLSADVDLPKIAHDHEITGGQMINVVRHAALLALQRSQREVNTNDLLAGLRRERLSEL